MISGTSYTKRRRTKDDIAVLVNGLQGILTEYNPMTVRQTFYQMVARGLIAKTETEYHTTVCRLLTKLRLAGDIPFGWIADNTRWMRKPRTYDSLDSALRLTVETYRRALWSRMPEYVEIWIEKDALAGVIYSITSEWDVPLMVTRGYPSLSYVYEAAEYISELQKPTYIYYFGDYDPSGLDISRSLEDRLRLFAPGAELYFERVAINDYQIRMYNLPTRPTKPTDSRAKRFGGDACVELDALDPARLREIVEFCILKHINGEEYQRLRQIEDAERESLQWVVEHMHVDESGNMAIIPPGQGDFSWGKRP
jgi:hypothetical protein